MLGSPSTGLAAGIREGKGSLQADESSGITASYPRSASCYKESIELLPLVIYVSGCGLSSVIYDVLRGWQFLWAPLIWLLDQLGRFMTICLIFGISVTLDPRVVYEAVSLGSIGAVTHAERCRLLLDPQSSAPPTNYVSHVSHNSDVNVVVLCA